MDGDLGSSWRMTLRTKGMFCSLAGRYGQLLIEGSRMNQMMEKLQKMEKREYTSLIRVLFGLGTPTPVPSDLSAPGSGYENLEFLDPTLNDSQKDAIRFALASREVALLHGPPGVSPCNGLLT